MHLVRDLGTAAVVMGLLAVPVSAVGAQADATIDVAADGGGDHDSINAALDAAAPGDTIVIWPGEYAESLHLDKPITLIGAGTRAEVVIVPEPGDAFPREDVDGARFLTGVLVEDADATLERLTIGGVDGVAVGIVLAGGSPVLRDVVSDHAIEVTGDTDALIESSDLGHVRLVGPDARATVRDNTIDDAMVVIGGATGTAEGNLFLDWPIDIFERSSLDIVGNTFRPEEGAPAVWVDWSGASANVIDNVIEGAWQGVVVQHGSSARIEGNTITDPHIGIMVVETDALVRGNTITGASELGILVSGNGITVEDNTISDSRVGLIVEVPNGYPPNAPRFDEPSRVVGNTVTDASHFGLVVVDATPLVSGNSICGGREPLRLEGDADPELGDNDFCLVDG